MHLSDFWSQMLLSCIAKKVYAHMCAERQKRQWMCMWLLLWFVVVVAAVAVAVVAVVVVAIVAVAATVAGIAKIMHHMYDPLPHKP